MAMDQLDRMTAVLSLPPGHFYEQYIQECMVEAVPNWRRIKPFLYRCAELNKLECIKHIVQLLMDNLTYSPLLFEVAEDFFIEARHEAAALLYESVAVSERRQHSERLAFCQYRLFTLRLSEDQERNLQAALQFEPFIDRLDEIDQLDALRDLANTYRSMRRWDRVESIANEMEEKASAQLLFARQPLRKRQETDKKTKQPLFVYLALSYLFRASVCDSRGDYEQALRYNYAYADLNWVEESDEESLRWVNLFKEWAHANIFVSKLLSGDQSVLPEYVEFIGKNKDEVLTGLLNIMKAANQYNLDVDDILEHFESEINVLTDQKQSKAMGLYAKLVISERSIRFLYELAHYHLRKKVYHTGFNNLLNALGKSVIMNNETYILKCVRLFERYRVFSTEQMQQNYQALLKEEEENEKKIGVNVSGI
ncbi:transcriptional regulator [Paenibacillus sp. sgz500958]|uniref:transcriptional regulator n=1 Tax=Paenibacillus sp. sgz500958 TaxID=3242475 RepID=UPI0036D36077